MPIKIIDMNESVGILISGQNFDLLKDIVKTHKFKYNPKIDEIKHVWTGKGLNAIRAINELLEFESFEVPDKILEKLKPKLETEKFRIPLKEELLKSKPFGDFQINGIKNLIKQNRFMLAWEMGLGKSFTVISAINHLWEKGLVDSVLVVAPSESIYNFREEFMKFNSFGLTYEDFYIANAKNRNPFESNAKIIIMTYRTFLMLSDDSYFKLKGKRSKSYRSPVLPVESWGSKRAIILDESHKIKNISARQTKALHIHKHFFDFRYELTGTPDPNGVDGLYSQITFLDSGIIGEDFESWKQEIAVLGTKWSPYAIRYFRPEKVKDFIEDIKPWFDRQFAKDNLDLPSLYIKKNYVELNEKQMSIYKELISYTLSIVKEENGRIIPKEVFNKFPFLIQALDDPCLLKGKIDQLRSPLLFKQVEKWKFEDHSKLEACSSLLDSYISEEKKKVILWSGHPDTMNRLKEYYKKYNPIMIHGQIEIPKGLSKDEHKNSLLETFKKSKKNSLLIASYYVLSTAVNIVEAPRSIYWDRSLNPVDYFQSLKRNHRIGQDEKVISNIILLLRSIDMRMDKLMDRKEKMNLNLMESDSLSKEEWKSLFLGEIL